MTAEIAYLKERLATWRERPDIMVRELFGATPDAWQDEVLQAFPHNQRLALKAPIDVNSSVWTPKGQKRWGDVLPGDRLFAEDGSVCHVVRRFEAGRSQLYRVTFRDGTSLRVTADHEWDITTKDDRRHGKPRKTVSTRDLLTMKLKTITGQRVVSIPPQGPAQFPIAQLPADPYIFGLWLGDGVANESRLICPDMEIRKAIVARGQPISESEAVTKRIGLVDWLPSLRATGMATCRSYEKYIPDQFKFASVEQRLDLLRGLMDSDGTCATNGHTYLASCSEHLIEDFLWLARSLGFVAKRMGPYLINDGENRDSYRAVICGPICPFLADTPKRKRWRSPKYGKTIRFIDSVKPDGHGEAVCVEVDSYNHCFQADQFIVTHNCKGPGKTCVLAWLAWNFLLTRPQPKIAATSISADNLSDNLWTEMALWMGKAPLLKKFFRWTKTRIESKEMPETWWMAARSWSKTADKSQQANTLAGLHADYIMFIIDESGGVPDAVMASAEAALSSCIEGHLLQAGNPTHLEGPLYRASTTERNLWWVRSITGDPDNAMRSPRVSVTWARQQIEKYGRDNPWVLVNVFGEFPPSSINALIGPEEVRDAMKRIYTPHDIMDNPLIFGVDVARFGDDASVIFPRRGLQAFSPRKLRNVTGRQGAAVLSRMWENQQPDAVFIDDTGGYGATWIEALESHNRVAIGVGYARSAHDDAHYANKRAEMYFDAVDWIKKGGALPHVEELVTALSQTTYTFKGDKLLLEPKEDIKLKIGFSPDDADAFVMTFAEPVAKRSGNMLPGGASRHSANYDPFSEQAMRSSGLASAVTGSYDPFNQ